MSLHRLKPIDQTQKILDQEITNLVTALRQQLNSSLVQVYLFGSASRGISHMHLHSDIDLCAVINTGVETKPLYGTLPLSKIFPVDWIVVNQDDFDQKVKHKHGVFYVAAMDGIALIQ